jgi:hypothetical protein
MKTINASQFITTVPFHKKVDNVHEVESQASWRGIEPGHRDITGLSAIQQIHDRGDNRGNDDPEQLKPVEKGNACELRVPKIIERRPAERDKRDEEEKKERFKPPLRSTGCQNVSPFAQTTRVEKTSSHEEKNSGKGARVRGTAASEPVPCRTILPPR